MANLFDILNFPPTSQDSSSKDARPVDVKIPETDSKNQQNVRASPVSRTTVQPTFALRLSPRTSRPERRKSGQASDTTSDSSTHEQAALFELDTLKQFTIPKKKKMKKGD